MIQVLYVGGPATRNLGLNSLPGVPFNPESEAFQLVKPSAHKGSTQFALTRVLDTEQDVMSNFLQTLSREGAPLEVDDQLGIILLPKNMLYYGVYFEVERAVEGLTVTPGIRDTAIVLPAIDCSVVGNGFAVLDAAAWVEEGTVDLSAAFFTNNPHILDLVVTAIDADTQLGNLRLTVSPLASLLVTGQY